MAQKIPDTDLELAPNEVPKGGAEAPKSGASTVAQRSVGDHAEIPIPSEARKGSTAIEVPASRSSISDASSLMHNLSIAPSMKDRRASRNSFGTSLPIPRSPRPSRLSLGPDAPGALRDILASQVQDLAKEKTKAAKNMAFAFDIDGVLLHGDKLIPQATRVMELLNGDNELGIKIPYILLTNGGGKTEVDRVDQISRILGHPISTQQFIQSHTPMQALSEYYETVLVVGGEGFKTRAAAEAYGFKNVVVPKDILAWDPSISPWRNFSEEERKQARPRDFDNMNFDAILVFADSRDYATDFQIIIDLLLSENGRLRTKAKDPTEKQMPIYFSQGDIIFTTDHKLPRMTQGLFRMAIEMMYKTLTGADLERVVYGKPELATYKYADEVMMSWMKEIHNEQVLPENIYMIGDNPASDIIGGNMYGWNTCLVRTGVFQGKDNDENSPANFGVFDNVLEAVQAAVRKELGTEFKFRWSENEKVKNALNGQGAAVE
ncbi:TIGR01456 family HAD hydrolase [Helicocarpus griseus UAMH5409]|uniref:TIGR01456 family HAD hydrolase n=1 Tax=Helicocarpus griseus UAMH5409 TaxID=1447875 RepID=A0A2B7Y3A3_9EURO|nr:TIGR01456 family HAD hydrolase [Helicocarpus griseus UAMH5409]